MCKIHAPRPWTASAKNFGSTVLDRDGKAVATIVRTSRKGVDYMELYRSRLEDLALMAAAPDMLEALEKILKMADDAQATFSKRDLFDAVPIILEAIKKAKTVPVPKNTGRFA